MGTAIKHHVPDRVKSSFVILDIWALWHSPWFSSETLALYKSLTYLLTYTQCWASECPLPRC